ncbi:hypothetical protein ACFLVS_02095 [Chloroflexota bacterium]
MDKAHYQELFLFAAKVGSLEGYLFQRTDLEPLDDWVDNILRMYEELPAAVKKDVAPVLAVVLKRVLDYGETVLKSELRKKLEQVLLASSKAE